MFIVRRLFSFDFSILPLALAIHHTSLLFDFDFLCTWTCAGGGVCFRPCAWSPSCFPIFLRLPAHLPVCSSARPSTCLPLLSFGSLLTTSSDSSVRPSVRLSVYPSVRPAVCLSDCPVSGSFFPAFPFEDPFPRSPFRIAVVFCSHREVF